jgi:hypothetical protein
MGEAVEPTPPHIQSALLICRIGKATERNIKASCDLQPFTIAAIFPELWLLCRTDHIHPGGILHAEALRECIPKMHFTARFLHADNP